MARSRFCSIPRNQVTRRQIQSVKVRAAGKSDAEAVARLAGELSCIQQPTRQDSGKRLDLRSMEDPRHATVFVAVVAAAQSWDGFSFPGCARW